MANIKKFEQFGKFFDDGEFAHGITVLLSDVEILPTKYNVFPDGGYYVLVKYENRILYSEHNKRFGFGQENSDDKTITLFDVHDIGRIILDFGEYEDLQILKYGKTKEFLLSICELIKDYESLSISDN